MSLIGKKFGRLTVLSAVDKPFLHCKWNCVCECGNTVSVIGGNLKRGNTKSCGCLNIQRIQERNKVHGFYGTQFYRTFHKIKQRCCNPKYPEYNLYGGRGIKNLWKSFEEFKDDMYESYLKHTSIHKEGRNTSIDRIDVNGNYCKENCRWATIFQQSRNKRSNRMFTYENKTLCITDWAKEKQISEVGLRKRLNRGWDFNRAINEPFK